MLLQHAYLPCSFLWNRGEAQHPAFKEDNVDRCFYGGPRASFRSIPFALIGRFVVARHLDLFSGSSAKLLKCSKSVLPQLEVVGKGIATHPQKEVVGVVLYVDADSASWQ